jgi:hypothetical protein
VGGFPGTIPLDVCNVTLQLISPELQKKDSYKNSGMLSIECTFIDSASFLDFVHSGINLNFTVAIDYTASNGQPEQPTSLFVLLYFFC